MGERIAKTTEEESVFFFEKKKQKTFIRFIPCVN